MIRYIYFVEISRQTPVWQAFCFVDYVYEQLGWIIKLPSYVMLSGLVRPRDGTTQQPWEHGQNPNDQSGLLWWINKVHSKITRNSNTQSHCLFPLNRLSFVLPANILLQYQVWLNLQTNMIENLGQFEGFICVYPTTMRQIRCMLHISEFCNVTIFVVLAVLWRVSAPCECLQSVGDIPARHSHH